MVMQCSLHVRDENCHKMFGHLKERDGLEYLVVGWKTVLMWIL